MPVYVYETVEADEPAEARRFEVRQSMRDPALTHDPLTGRPVRRIILGGLEIPRAPAMPRRAPVCQSHGGPTCPCCR